MSLTITLNNILTTLKKKTINYQIKKKKFFTLYTMIKYMKVIWMLLIFDLKFCDKIAKFRQIIIM